MLHVRRDSKTVIDSMQKFQETFLMAAVREGSVGMVKKMIQRGANVNIANANKVTGNLTPCLMFA